MEVETAEEVKKIQFNIENKEPIQVQQPQKEQKSISPAELEKDFSRIPQKRSVFLMWFLSVITLDIYAAFWYVKRVPEFYNLGTNKKLSKKLSLTLLITNIVFILLIIAFPFTITLDNVVSYESLTSTQVFLLFGIGIVYLFKLFFLILLAFYSRTIINQAIENKGHSAKISGFFTLIFNLYYLQYEINRVIDDKENQPRKGPWVVLTIIALLAAISFLMSTFV